MLTASFSEARRDLTEIANKVVEDGAEFTIFKRSKPLFKIVPVTETPDTPSTRRGSARATVHDREEERALPMGAFDEMVQMRSACARPTGLSACDKQRMHELLGMRDV